MTFSDDDKFMTKMFDTYWGTFSESGEPSPSTENLGEFDAWPQYVSDN